MADRVRELEREIDELQRQLHQQNQNAERERQRMLSENRRAIESYQQDMRRAVREHDENAKKEYERLLKEYQRNIDREVQNELSDMNGNYRKLLDDVKKSERELERKNQELEAAVQSIRNDMSKRNEGSSREAKEYLLNATGEFHEIEKKPHEKFMPKRLNIYRQNQAWKDSAII